MTKIIEIGFEISSDKEEELLGETIARLNIPFYVEPPNRFNSLEDLECQCEGK
jgi:hypothetical protein